MKAIIKSIDLNDAVGFDQYWPENEECFGIWLTVQIGPDDQEGGHLFQILVCTPEWIQSQYSSSGAVWGRHMLIVFEYDQSLIVKEISNYIDKCSGGEFWEVAQKISRIGAWEFEDYQA
ncbi:immunity 8 family protein [Halotalea alkalilenta]|uniref:immunity 8 family protein n=1 Tax=Halotalea alkalilenta TaxID=376489 RepID=UPI0009DE81EC|nr:immunity 8 family protein [Halotalea alkalilenta]